MPGLLRQGYEDPTFWQVRFGLSCDRAGRDGDESLERGWATETSGTMRNSSTLGGLVFDRVAD
jgi:hypothetical protein